MNARIAARPGATADATGGRDVERARVLLVGTDDWAVEQTAPTLVAAGYDVLRCHEPGEPAFPCNALRPGRSCPVDVGFDVVVTVRARGLGTLAEGEFGVVCALHSGRPLVVAGVAAQNPLKEWATALVDRGGDVVSAARTAIDTKGQP